MCLCVRALHTIMYRGWCIVRIKHLDSLNNPTYRKPPQINRAVFCVRIYISRFHSRWTKIYPSIRVHSGNGILEWNSRNMILNNSQFLYRNITTEVEFARVSHFLYSLHIFPLYAHSLYFISHLVTTRMWKYFIRRAWHIHRNFLW